ncbi:helix-turn-helix transcriptional regulator [Qipengyuania sp. ASV99]|uniref:helix-turn-helix transcriptional regulator n=1 Tax=Qipengyuania sp. ASV99 TaxID=3399681 RepID=UPI003A4C6937
MVTCAPMQWYFDQIDALHDIEAVLRFAREICVKQGVVRMSYHVTPPFDGPTSSTTVVYTEGFSAEWLEMYEQEEFRASDPIPRRVMQSGSMMSWADAIAAGPNTPENEAYFAAMRQFGLIHGIGVPLYGPRGRAAYASFDFDRPVPELSDDQLGTVRSVAQAGHQRICILIDESSDTPSLSEREIEVLTWAARGKSVGAIATILGLSPDTVKTYSKRIYAKLDVTDRVGAVVKALRLGLVRV